MCAVAPVGTTRTTTAAPPSRTRRPCTSNASTTKEAGTPAVPPPIPAPLAVHRLATAGPVAAAMGANTPTRGAPEAAYAACVQGKSDERWLTRLRRMRRQRGARGHPRRVGGTRRGAGFDVGRCACRGTADVCRGVVEVRDALALRRPTPRLTGEPLPQPGRHSCFVGGATRRRRERRRRRRCCHRRPRGCRGRDDCAVRGAGAAHAHARRRGSHHQPAPLAARVQSAHSSPQFLAVLSSELTRSAAPRSQDFTKAVKGMQQRLETMQ